MLEIVEIAFCSYAVTDMARSRTFYEGVLGLKPARAIATPNGEWVEYEIGATALSLGRAPGWQPSPDGGTVALEVGDFDVAIAHLRERGVRFRLEPVATPVCRLAMISDPDGNTICLHQRNAGQPRHA